MELGAHRPTGALRRDRSRRWIGGVCAGVARHLGWNVALVRAVWLLVGAIPVLPGFPAYLLCWFLLPLDEGSGPDRPGRSARRRMPSVD